MTKFTVTDTGVSRKSKKYLYISIALVLVGLVTLIIGIYLVSASNEDCPTSTKPKPTSKPVVELTTTNKPKPGPSAKKIKDLDEYCSLSDEAQRIDLPKYLKKVKALYFELFPAYKLADLGKVDQAVINRVARESFKPFIPTPEWLKSFADRINALRVELDKIGENAEEMKPKENQILAESKMYLKQFFAEIYDIDFYGGDWMFGPNYFCQNRACNLVYDILEFTRLFKPMNIEDVRFAIKSLLGFRKTYEQLTSNLKLGVEVGMVRTKISCKSGADAFKDYSKEIFAANGAIGKHWVADYVRHVNFVSALPKSVQKEWEANNKGVNVSVSVEKALQKGFAESIHKYHKYLIEDHYLHCPENDDRSGISDLPYDYVYENHVANKSRPTTKKLPITNATLNGKELYEHIMPRFTTVGYTPEEVFAKGEEQLKKLYPEIVNISKAYTKKSDEKEAIKEIRTILDGDEQFHGDMTFPEIENNATAHARCIDHESAQKYCPKRWASIQKWADYLRGVLSYIHPRLVNAFHFTGEKNSVPNCPVEMWPHYNPSNGAMYFQLADETCSHTTKYGLPFFLKKYGPKFQEWSVSGHEARPGHHFQMQGGMELFRDPCGGDSQFIHDKGYYVGFIEGWALYGENPVLSDDVKLYADDKDILQRLGMFKWQVWRAVRLVVDTGLHYRGMNQTWALKQFDDFCWDTTDFAKKEINRYMSCPGQATGYMIGRLAIIEARKKAEKELGALFNLKDFHLQMLALGQTPLEYMSAYIDRWVSCVKDSTKKFCEYLLSPIGSIPPGEKITGKKFTSAKPIQVSKPRRHFI